MVEAASILELRRRTTKHAIYAVRYRSRRARGVERLPDGAIVEAPTEALRGEAPEQPAPCLELTSGGVPATIHDICLGLVSALVALDGVYVLPSGDVAAIYGAEVVPIGAPARPED